jgi:hypothetical protein
MSTDYHFLVCENVDIFVSLCVVWNKIKVSGMVLQLSGRIVESAAQHMSISYFLLTFQLHHTPR